MTGSISLGIILIIASIQVGHGELNCYKCEYTKMETDNSVLDFMFDVIAKLSDEHCKLDSDDDYYEVSRRLCPPAPSGKVNKCVNLNGEISTSVKMPLIGNYIDFTYKTIARNCEAVDINDRDTSDGCHDNLPSYAPIRSLATDAFQNYELGTLNFKGKVCYGGEFSVYTGKASSAIVSWFLLALIVTLYPFV